MMDMMDTKRLVLEDYQPVDILKAPRDFLQEKPLDDYTIVTKVFVPFEKRKEISDMLPVNHSTYMKLRYAVLT